MNVPPISSRRAPHRSLRQRGADFFAALGKRPDRKIAAVVILAVKRFSSIDGPQWAAAFSHYAFFSLFPLVVLLVNLAATFVERDRARDAIIGYIENYVPLDPGVQARVFDTVVGVIEARGTASLVALVILAWTAMRFFATLIRAINRAWGGEAHRWWRLPAKSLLFLGVIALAVFFGVAAPIAAKLAKSRIFPGAHVSWWLDATGGFLVPVTVVFFSLGIFYMVAPRRKTRFAEVWKGALAATLLLHATENLFVIYLQHFSSLNLVYGGFGGIMALLLWIYLSGSIFIFGACLCAAEAEVHVSHRTAGKS